MTCKFVFTIDSYSGDLNANCWKLSDRLTVRYLNTGLNLVWYSDHHLNTGPVFKWWSEYQTSKSSLFRCFRNSDSHCSRVTVLYLMLVCTAKMLPFRRLLIPRVGLFLSSTCLVNFFLKPNLWHFFDLVQVYMTKVFIVFANPNWELKD